MLPASDIISTLPDPLLGLILSKIPIKKAVRCSILSQRCSILSQRWRFLYTQIPHLTLTPYLILGYVNGYPDVPSIALVENIISNLLVLHSTDLETFHLCNYICRRSSRSLAVDREWQVCQNIERNAWRFSRQSVWKWVRYAAWKNAKHLTLCTSHEMEEVPPALFCCTHLTDLELFNCIITRIPARFPGFNHLVTDFFRRIEFTDESFSCFSHCPFLERLEILGPVGLRKPIISAPNLTYLVIRAKEEVEVLIVDCPKLVTLEAREIRDLSVNGVSFQEFSHAFRYLKMQSGSNFIVLRLVWHLDEYGLSAERENFSAERFLEFVRAFKTLKELSIPHWSLVQAENEMFELTHELLDTLPNLERLDVPGYFVMEIVRDPIRPSLSSSLADVRIIKVEILKYTGDEIALLRSFLEGCSTLEIMELQRLSGITHIDKIEFLTELLSVRTPSDRPIVDIDACLKCIIPR